MPNIPMGHLGGHLGITHTDEGALKWIRDMGNKTMLDVGCGPGGNIAVALDLGINAYGFDGDYNLTASVPSELLSRISFNDLTKCSYNAQRTFDFIWCCEVAEHIEEAYTPNLIKTLRDNVKEGGIVMMTANEGPGVHHVNRKPPEWWVAKMAEFGLKHDPELTAKLKEVSTMKREFIRETGNIYIKL